MNPTTENLQALIWDARKESAKAGGAAEMTPNDPGKLIAEAADLVMILRMLLGYSVVPWSQIRTAALHLLHLAAVIAWHAGTRAMGMRSDPQTSAEMPEAKSDVDALLEEADAAMGRTWPDLGIAVIAARLATALRTERGRADDAESSARRGWDARDAMAIQHGRAQAERMKAVSHLRDVIAWQWPDGTKPRPVREADAFLAGSATTDISVEAWNGSAGFEEEHRKEHADHERTKAYLAAMNKAHEKALRERDAAQVALGRTASELGEAREYLRRALAAQNAADAALLDERGVSAGLREKLAAAREDVRIVEEAAVRLARATSKGVA